MKFSTLKTKIIDLFARALKMLQPTIDYFRYNRNYWNARAKKRLRNNAVVIALLLVIAFEGYAAATEQYPWRAAYSLGSTLKLGVKEISTDFPWRALAYVNWFLWERREPLSAKELGDYLNHPSVRARIRALIIKDRKVKYSGVGGAVVLATDKDSKYLRFIEIDSDHIEFAKDFIRNKDNKEYIKKLFESHKDRFRIMYTDPNLFDRVLAQINQGKRSEFMLDLLIASYLDHCDSWHSLSYEQLLGLFYPRVLRGELVGIFNIYAYGGWPSAVDLGTSRNIRKLTIEAIGNGFVVYDFMDGRINAQIKKKF